MAPTIIANSRAALSRFYFNQTLFYPGYNLECLDRQLGSPVPPDPSYSIQDERWRREHRPILINNHVMTNITD